MRPPPPRGTIRNREQRSRRRGRRLLEPLLALAVSQVKYICTGGSHRRRGKRGNSNSTPNWKRKKRRRPATTNRQLRASGHGSDSCSHCASAGYRCTGTITLGWSGDGLPLTTMSRQSRDSCQVHPGLRYGMMVSLVFRYEHRPFLFAWGIGLREVPRERRCRVPIS